MEVFDVTKLVDVCRAGMRARPRRPAPLLDEWRAEPFCYGQNYSHLESLELCRAEYESLPIKMIRV